MENLVGLWVNLRTGERVRIEGVEHVLAGDLQRRQAGCNLWVNGRWVHLDDVGEVL